MQLNTTDGEPIEIATAPVTQGEATILCVHHLMLAASYFEAVPDDFSVVLDYLHKRMPDGSLGKWGCVAFLISIQATYNRYNEGQPID